MGRGQPSCEELDALTSQLGARQTAPVFRDWVHRRYWLLPWEVSTVTYDSGRTELSWNKGPLEFWGIVDEDRVVDIFVGNRWSGVSSAQVMDCLGSPAAYSAEYHGGPGGPTLIVQLVFPELGVLVSGQRHVDGHPDQPPEVSGTFLMTGFRVVLPGSTDDVVREVFQGRADVVYSQGRFRPWLGSWDTVVVDDSYGEHKSRSD